MSSKVAIVTTAHWEGDPRLNRHLLYLERAGHDTELLSLADGRRVRALLRALLVIARSDADLVVLPDPELFLLGSVTARLTGKSPVIDIHEDYRRSAISRDWVPGWARWLVSAGARVAVGMGRLAAGTVVVAASELARAGDVVVLNVPDPGSLVPAPYDGSRRLVYVGDVTIARGVDTMLEALSILGGEFRLVLIGGVEATARERVDMLATHLGVADLLDLVGRIDHTRAWQLASGALAGLSLLTPAPAYLEAKATKLWEYMAIGLPVIVTDLPGQAGLVRLIHPSLVCRTAEEVAMAARRLAEDAEFRARVAKAGRRLVEETWREARPDLAIQSVVAP